MSLSAATDRPRSLTIDGLRLSPQDPLYEDAIACLKAYWRQATAMNDREQREMIFSILTRRFQVNKSARPGASSHRLYRQAMKNDRENTWGTYLLLEALYHKLPDVYVESVERKFSGRVNSNETSRYMAFFPNTVQPTRADRDTAGARAFRTLYPKLRNVPYWARMGLEEPVIDNVASYRDISFDSDEQEETTPATVQDSIQAAVTAPEAVTQSIFTPIDLTSGDTTEGNSANAVASLIPTFNSSTRTAADLETTSLNIAEIGGTSSNNSTSAVATHNNEIRTANEIIEISDSSNDEETPPNTNIAPAPAPAPTPVISFDFSLRIVSSNVAISSGEDTIPEDESMVPDGEVTTPHDDVAIRNDLIEDARSRPINGQHEYETSEEAVFDPHTQLLTAISNGFRLVHERLDLISERISALEASSGEIRGEHNTSQ